MSQKGFIMELLAPAGTMENFMAALESGADAIYLGGKVFNARAHAANFGIDELREAVRLAHILDVSVYVTVNILIGDTELGELENYLKDLDSIGVDAIIVQDLAVAEIAKRVAPNLPLHLSTQANTLNSEAALFWHEQGIERIVLARELTLSQIAQMRRKLPETLELEAFVHGAMCVSYSGRCLFSNYIDGRDSNRGECVQPCRWSYEIRERGNDGEYFTVVADRKGSFILNSRDMCMAEHLNEVIDSGIISLKIEGRMKSILYVATVVNAYRMALDGCDMELVMNELNRISHRPYTTGFMLDNDAMGSKAPLMAPESGGYIQDYAIAAVVLDYDSERKIAHVEQRNRFFDGDELHILAPKDVARAFRVNGIRSEEGEMQQSAPHPCQKLYIGCSEPVAPGSILRVAAKKNPVFSA